MEQYLYFLFTFYLSHVRFLSSFQENYTKSKRLIKDCNITVEDPDLIQLCQSFQDEASWKIQNAVRDWHELKMKNLKKDFNKIKDRLFLHAKHRAGKLFVKVKTEINRLDKKMNKVKQRKSTWMERHFDPKAIDNIRNFEVDHEVYINLNRKKHRRGKKKKGQSSRNHKKKKRRQRKLRRKREEWKKIPGKAHEINLPDNMYETLDHTNYQWSEVEKKVTSLGLKFVPTVRRSNTPRKYTDFLEFCRKLRLAIFFYHINKQTTVINEAENANEHQHSNNQVNHKGQQYDYEE